MLDIEMIDNTIQELENADTTFVNCQKLASLYTVKQFYEDRIQTPQQVEQEFQDILPRYRKYCEVKRHYQLNEASEQQVLDCLEEVGREIREFFQTLYSSTDMPEERHIIKNILNSIQFM